MKLLYYTWKEITENDLYDSLISMNIEVDLCDYQLKSYINDPAFVIKLEELIKHNNYDAVITFNFIPVISKVALRNKMPYICWIYDSPCMTLYSEMIYNPYNYMFHFDNAEAERIRKLGVEHIWHMPLGVNVSRIDKTLVEEDFDKDRLSCDVSFMGNLYNGDEQKQFNAFNILPDRLKGYIKAVIDSTLVMTGGELVDEMLNDEMIEKIGHQITFSKESEFFVTDKAMLAEMLKKRVSMLERIEIAKMFSNNENIIKNNSGNMDFKLFTQSDCSTIEGVESCGIIDYYKEMPHLFYNSKININATIRNIRTGIPLRAMDIIGAGGFLLSSFTQELAYYFGEDEVAIYFGLQDLKEKADAFLLDEDKRMKMSQAANRKIRNNFTYEIQLEKILDKIYNHI